MGNCISRHPQTGSTQEGYSDKHVVSPELSPCPSFPIKEPTQSFWTYPKSCIATHNSCDNFPTHADVVIIGSGISGASFARTLLDIDLDQEGEGASRLNVVMLEAQETCSGATGRNGGHINPPLYHDYADLKQSLGLRRAQQIMRFRLAHLEVLSAVAEEEPDSADCREVETVDVHFHETAFVEAKRKLSIYKEDMPHEASTYRVWEGEEARNRYSLSPLAVGCITTRAGAVHPYRFVTSILSGLLEEHSKCFQLFTQTPCTSIIEPSTRTPFYSLNTPRGQLTASHVVHLTNAYVGGLLPNLADVVHRVRETMSAQRPGKGLHLNTAGDGKGCGRSYIFYDSPKTKEFDYLTQLPDGEHELMFGGGLEAVPDAGAGQGCTSPGARGMYDVHSAAHVSGALPIYFGPMNWGAEAEAEFVGDRDADGHERSPWAAGRIKALWSGVLGISADEFPWVGRVTPTISGRRVPPNIKHGKRMAAPGEWVAAGYSGEGMVNAWLCARGLALMVLGLEAATDMEFEGHYGAGQSVDQWLPACYRISEMRWRYARRNSKGLEDSNVALVRGGTGKMKVYSGL
ncbi:FAD dependent oxidoreductase-domain-containing protein [Melanogaster broomeanus]|nr:FAD dependent oxidoreductase-domain-containing protein [Melanogaster broomeanus]